MDRRARQISLQHKSNESVNDEVSRESLHKDHINDGQKRKNFREKHNQNVCSEQGRQEKSGESHGRRRNALGEKRRSFPPEIHVRRLLQFL